MILLRARLVREFRIFRALVAYRRGRIRGGVRPSMEYASIRVENEGSIRIGDRACFSSAEGRTLLQVRPGASLVIGRHAFINSGVTITAAQSVKIGDNVKIGSNVAVSDSGGHELVSGDGVKVLPVVIGDNVWLGRGAFIMPGVSVGANSIVAAGAIVSSDVEANTVVGGVPARFIRSLRSSSGNRL